MRHVVEIVALIVILGLVGGGVSGCQSRASTHGKDGIEATYSAGTLTSRLPDSVNTRQVMAAAEQMLRDRGYSILENAQTDDSGRLVAVPPRDSLTPRVTILGRTTAGGVRVDIGIAPFGSQDLSTSLLDGILRRLGL